MTLYLTVDDCILFIFFIYFNVISSLYHFLPSYTITLHCIKDFYTCKGEGLPL
jgi:hypothetical protein